VSGGVNSATTGRRPPHLHRHLDPRPEPIDDPHKAIDRKTVQVRVADPREIRRRNAGPIMRLPNAQALAVERLDNLGGQERLELPDIRIRHIQVSVDVSAPADNFKLFIFHRNISFNRFSRSIISSISRCGVLIPCVDFFWERMHDPQLCPELHSIHHKALHRPGDIRLPAPSAAIVSAARHIDCASSGNLPNSFCAPLIQEIGRVGLVIHYLVI
jgi:hypothetical protein